MQANTRRRCMGPCLSWRGGRGSGVKAARDEDAAAGQRVAADVRDAVVAEVLALDGEGQVVTEGCDRNRGAGHGAARHVTSIRGVEIVVAPVLERAAEPDPAAVPREAA